MKNTINSLIVFLFSLMGCRAQKIILKNSIPNNITSNTFKMKINDVPKFLLEGYKDSYYSGNKLTIKEMYYNDYDKYKSIWPNKVKKILSYEENKYDVWLKIVVDSSDIYYSKGKPLEYLMECIVHLNIVDSAKVKVEIKVVNSKVHIRDELLPSPPHFVKNPIYKNVEPTTIEEYKIIRCIAKKLGVLDQLPPLKF